MGLDKQGGFPYYTGFTPLFRNGFSLRPPIFDKLIQWACGSPTTLDDGTVIVEDKKGKSGLAGGREGVSGAYLDGDGIRKLLFPGYPNTAFTYVDHTTKTTENGTTDASSEWLVPTNGVDTLTLDGFTFNFEGGNADNVCVGIEQ